MNRNTHKISCIITVLLMCSSCFHSTFAQLPSPYKTSSFLLTSDTLKLDSLSIIPGSLELFDTASFRIPATLYQVNFFTAQLIPGDSLKAMMPLNLQARYRVFPYDFSKEYYRKKAPPPYIADTENPFVYRYSPSGGRSEILDFGGLNKNGSITRGVSFGNNQDMVVNSNMNIQLAGRIGDEIDLVAAISDNNIPVQPEGNTAQIQEFDKVFIRMSKDRTSLIAGDFELGTAPSHFMHLNKKAQGGYFSTRLAINRQDTAARFNFSTAAAISKGKYAKNIIQGMEGNQGPYKLTGADNEHFIIILAGSEKVYIDGRLLSRGQENDYVIDYNMAEVTFTPKNLITKDKRIVIEFEYSDKKYARSLFYSSTGYTGEKVSVQFNFFSEQDLKNQPLTQTLDEEQKEILRLAGDSSHLAFYSSIDSLGFNTDEIRYKLIDTLGYDSVLVYSTHPDSAYYRALFSRVSPGNGNYVQQINAVNGRVFKWVAPVNGIPQGDYEPVMLLFAPAKKQLVTLNTRVKVGKNTLIIMEGAFSNNDLNTFSSKDTRDNNDVAFKTGISTQGVMGKDNSWTYTASLNHEYTGRNFQPVDPYRHIEFNRNWNLNDNEKRRENISGLALRIKHKEKGQANYSLYAMLREQEYSGLQQQLAYALILNPVQSTADIRLTQTTTSFNNSSFLRHRGTLNFPVKKFNGGITTEGEVNRFVTSGLDSLLGNSFSYLENGVFAGLGDQQSSHAVISASRRKDQLPAGGIFKAASLADNFSLTSAVQLNTRNRIAIEARYRQLHILDTLLSSNTPDQTTTGRVEFSTRTKKNTVISTTFYEAGSGMEARREFSYLEVAPGQGAYTWTDYNGDGIRQLDEFEVATFQDQANYIRIYLQSNDYVKIYISQFSNTLHLNPAAVWASKKGWKKFVSRFSNQSALRLERKTTSDRSLEAFNPFVLQTDDPGTMYLNSSLRNTLSFNRSHPIAGIDYTASDNRNKSLQTNGFESRSLTRHTLRGRLAFKRILTLEMQLVSGIKANTSDFFHTRNYSIQQQEILPSLSWQPGNDYRISVSANFIEKNNTQSILLHPERAFIRRYSLEARYSSVNKGNLTAKFSSININYNAAENSAIAYEMLEALRPGQNFTWNAGLQFTFTGNLQLNLLYDGRKSPGANAIHTGNVQLRAYF